MPCWKPEKIKQSSLPLSFSRILLFYLLGDCDILHVERERDGDSKDSILADCVVGNACIPSCVSVCVSYSADIAWPEIWASSNPMVDHLLRHTQPECYTSNWLSWLLFISHTYIYIHMHIYIYMCIHTHVSHYTPLHHITFQYIPLCAIITPVYPRWLSY